MEPAVAEWLSEAWVQASGEVLGAEGPSPEGPTGLVAVELTGPDGGAYWRAWVEGVPVRGGVGKPEEAPDLTLTFGAAQARAFWRGEWSPSVAFMRGELKTAGDTGLLLTLLAAAARPEREALHRAVGELVSPS